MGYSFSVKHMTVAEMLEGWMVYSRNTILDILDIVSKQIANQHSAVMSPCQNYIEYLKYLSIQGWIAAIVSV